jgi:hypothetical protein
MSTLVIDGRFNGPPASANGGYACGAIALRAGGPAPLAVTLHAPVPVDSELELRPAGKRTHVWHGADLIATAAPHTSTVDTVDPVSLGDVSTAEYAGRTRHPFPTCFACGVEREHGDGLFLTPVPVAGRAETVACTWIPDDTLASHDGSIAPEIVWSALDCPGGWTTDPRDNPMVLGRMTAVVEELPVPQGKYVVVARQDSRTGRTVVNTSTLYNCAGVAIATASAIWIALAPTR